MRWMDKEETRIWKILGSRLVKQGNHQLAEYLKTYDLHLTSAKGVIGYTTPVGNDKNEIVLNRCLLDDQGNPSEAMDMVCVHEMLHILLSHISRDMKHVAARSPRIKEQLKEMGVEDVDNFTDQDLESIVHALGNIAADLDLSRYYNWRDIAAATELSGYILINYPQYEGMDFEDIYDTYLNDLQKYEKYLNLPPKKLPQEFVDGWNKACEDMRSGKIDPFTWDGIIPD